jgi:hypothetical protein
VRIVITVSVFNILNQCLTLIIIKAMLEKSAGFWGDIAGH